MTRFYYTAAADNQILYPTVYTRPDAQSIVNQLMTSTGTEIMVNVGGDLVEVEALYSLLVQSGDMAQDFTAIEESIEKAWNMSSNGNWMYLLLM